MSAALPAESYSLATLIDAWESSLHAVCELGKRLDLARWEAPTECAGWTAGDMVRHLAWIEARLAGRADAEHEVDWSQHPHVESDLSRLTETGVDLRRAHSQDDVCAELDGLIDLRLSQIMAIEPLRLDTEVMGVFGRPTTLERLLRIRAFDTWTHEQDMRRATRLPANLASPAAQVSAVQIAQSVPFVLARNLGAPVGTTLHVSVTGPIAFERWAGIDEDAQGTDIGELGRPDVATVSLTTDWETYARLSAGRLDVTDPEVLARLTIETDPSVEGATELATRIPEGLAITP